MSLFLYKCGIEPCLGPWLPGPARPILSFCAGPGRPGQRDQCVMQDHDPSFFMLGGPAQFPPLNTLEDD